MTQINLAEVERISRSCKRPRFALCTWLALLDLSGPGGQWIGARDELADNVQALLPPGRYEERNRARAKRVTEIRREAQAAHAAVEADLETLPPGDERENAGRFHHAVVAMSEREQVGNPIGSNLSRTLTELREAKLLEIEYIDGKGEAHAKPARGRAMSIHVYRLA